MNEKRSWKEDVWEKFLSDFWDGRGSGTSSVKYTKKEIERYLKEYTKSGQGEIRTFHYEHEKIKAVIRRNIKMIPISRNEWEIVDNVFEIDLSSPRDTVVFSPRKNLTEGMIAGIKMTMSSKSNPGETTLLAIANHVGIIADFYNLPEKGVLFTGGRQRAGVHIVINSRDIDMSKAQIEIDGGFEWSNAAVIVEMKSSFKKQKCFNVNQIAIPALKWKKLLPNKNVYALILLAETTDKGIEYWAYDFICTEEEGIFGKIAKSKKYILPIDKE